MELPPRPSQSERTVGVDPQVGATQAREEVPFHVAPGTASSQHAQLPLPAIGHHPVGQHPLGSVAQDVKHRVTVRHVRLFDEAFQSVPVDAQRAGVHPTEEAVGYPCTQIVPQCVRAAPGLVQVEVSPPFRRSTGDNLQPPDGIRGTVSQPTQRIEHRREVYSVLPVVLIKPCVSLTVVNTEVQCIVLCLYPGSSRSAERQHPCPQKDLK